MKSIVAVVGAGLTGCCMARLLAEKGHYVLLIEKEKYIGGLCHQYTDKKTGIQVSSFGAHVFHTNDKEVWDFVNRFSPFYPYTHSVYARWRGDWHLIPSVNKPELYAEYTKKMWGEFFDDMGWESLKRIDVGRLGKRYFLDHYQGIPQWGYEYFFRNMLDHNNIQLMLGTKVVGFDKENVVMEHGIEVKASMIIYTGLVPSKAPYRTMSIIHEENPGRYQIYPVVNYPGDDEQYIRSVEHQLLQFNYKTGKGISIVSFEYPETWKESVHEIEHTPPMYPIITEKNNRLFWDEANKFFDSSTISSFLVGRLGTYSYLDMDDCVRQSLDLIKEI